MIVEPTAQFRRQMYRLLTVVAVAMVCARILSAERVYEPGIHRAEPPEPNGPTRIWPSTRPLPSPTVSSNDRSRWAMVRALVDQGTFAIGQREMLSDAEPMKPNYRDIGIVFEDGWESIDKVLHAQTHLYYSSKPPLLPIIAAGEYWVLQK